MKLIKFALFCAVFKLVVSTEDIQTSDTQFQTSDLKFYVLKYIDYFTTGDFPISTKQVKFLEKVYVVLKQHNAAGNLTSNFSNCLADLEYLAEGFRHRNQNIMKMADATGKPGSGLMTGKLQWWGDYDECSQIYVPPVTNSSKGDFHAQYCRLDLWNYGNITMPIRWGLCVPDSCNGPALKSEIVKILNNTKEFSLHFEKAIVTSIEEGLVECQPRSTELSTGAWSIIYLFVMLVVLCMFGSCMTMLKFFIGKELCGTSSRECAPYELQGERTSENSQLDRKNFRQNEFDKQAQDTEATMENFQMEESQNGGRNTFEQFLSPVHRMTLSFFQEFFQCFCPIINTFGFVKSTASQNHVHCLDGIRLFGSLWVITCHTFGFLLPVIGNISETVDLINTIQFQIIMNGYYSVDIFFFLSGFLQAWQFLNRNGKVDFIGSIYHRLNRLFPAYVVVIFFQKYIFHLLGSGPVWPVNGRECEGYWWTPMIFLNNVLYTEHQCMIWSWYMACDFQYYCLTLIVLFVIRKCRLIGYVVSVFLAVASLLFSFGVTFGYDLFTGPANNLDLFKENPSLMKQKFTEFFTGLYISPYGRYHVFVVGALSACYFHRERMNIAATNLISKLWFCMGAIVTAIVTGLCFFGLYAFGQGISTLAASLYNSLHHLVFSLCFAWFVFQCEKGNLGIFNRILSARILVPFSHLTYCAYLVHPILMEAYYLSLRAPMHYSHWNFVILNFGFIFGTYIVAFILTIFFVAPVINLERFMKKYWKKMSLKSNT